MEPSQASLLILPCPKCHRWFKNKSGLTQHLNARHLVLARPPSLTDEQWSRFNGETEVHSVDRFPPRSLPVPGVESEFFLPAPDIDAEFFGLGKKLYRNYHKLLNGECHLATTMYTTIWREWSLQVIHVMHKGPFCPKVSLLLLFKKRQLMTGCPLRASWSSN